MILKKLIALINTILNNKIMGEIAEDMSDGTCCQLCGQYFANPRDEGYLFTHEYPVVFWDCWDELTNEEKELYIRAKVETL